MSNDKYYDDIHTFITTHGESGVNAISKGIDVPLSTVQKYLERQSYFKKTEQRKWDLPEKVNSDIQVNTLPLMVSSVENALLLVKAQLTDMQHLIDNSVLTTHTLKRGVDRRFTPVAALPDKSVDMDKRLLKLQDGSIKLKEVFKKQKSNIPEEYLDMIMNYDHVGLIIKEGIEYANNILEDEVYSMLMGNARELSEETVQILKDNQIE